MLLCCLLLQGYIFNQLFSIVQPSFCELSYSLAYKIQCSALELVKKQGRGHIAGFLLFSSKHCNKLQWLLSSFPVISMRVCTRQTHTQFTLIFLLIISHSDLRYNCSTFVIHSHFPYYIFTLSFSASMDNF